MSTTQRELLQLQNTTENPNTNNQKSSQLYEKERYEETAFDIIGNEEYGYFVAIGKYRLTEPQTKDECIKMIKEKDYKIILSLIEVGIMIHEEEKKLNHT